jgi:fructokinase
MHDAPLMLCAGEALTDMINQGGEQWVSRVGGSTWNVARALAVLGEPTAFAGAISQRPLRRCPVDGQRSEVGLDLRLTAARERSPLLAVVEKSEPPRYFFIGDDSADLHFDPAALPAGWSEALRWAHFGGISLAREPLASNLVALAQQLKAKGVAISYDPNYRNVMDERHAPTLQRWRRWPM